jgi:hypothetical protein
MEPSRQETMRARGRERLAQNPLYQQPGWTAVHARLLALFPHARTTIPAPFDMLPDPILEAADQVDALADSVLLDNPWRSHLEGRGTKAFEEYDKLELFDVVFAERPPTPGPLWFIPDDCFGSREPYLVRGEQLREFVASCPCSLSHDVLFIWCVSARVTVIHHEGGFFHLLVSEG